MKNMAMEVLRTFVTIVDVGGFTLAGEILGRSQPATSLQIKRLEEQVGKQLLTRKGQQLELTAAGKSLYRTAKEILALNDGAITQLTSKNISGNLHLGIPSEFASSLLPKIVRRFVQTYPNIALEVTCDLSKNLLAENRKKPFDLILTLHDETLKTTKSLLREDELVWVSSAHHSPHQRQPLPLVVAPDGCIYRNRIIKTLNKAELPWNIVYTIPDLTGIRSAVEEGLGVTVLAKSTVPECLKIHGPCTLLPELGKIGISLSMHKTDYEEAANRLMGYVKSNISG